MPASARKRWLWLVLVVLLAVVAGFVVWAETPPEPMATAVAALTSDDDVQVRQERWLTFHPTEPATTGLILYPGGRVDPAAYAPPARAIAAEGFLVVIVPMPLNLAVFAPDRADEVIAAFPAIERWAVGGHSLGGAMAARYALDHPTAVDGLALWASLPAASDDLSERQLAVASIYGTQDGQATPDEVEGARPLLPPDTVWTAIEGGNHAQFGWYGPQSGDGRATISRAEQQAQVVSATVSLLRSLTSQ